MRWSVLVPLLSLSLGFCSSLPAAVFEVAQRSPAASDDGPGTEKQPWKTLGKAAQAAGPGDSVLIRSGVYRESVALRRSGAAQRPIRFEAAPGEHVLVTGADRLVGWRKEDDGRPVYTVAWPHKFISWNRSMTHPDDAYHELIGRCEQVVADGYPLRQVLDRAQLAPGTFFADVSRGILFVWDAAGRDVNKLQVEGSVRQEIFRVEGDYVQLRGLRFRYAANMAQHGAVILAGAHDAMEDCVIEAMNSSGATFRGPDAVVRRCVFRDNGQLGFGAGRAHGLLFTECLVENNNTKGFDRGWEAGGNKLALCRDVVLERSRFLRNRGNGIWFDIGNTNCTVRQCLLADNDDAGIFYEISFRLRAQDNVIIGNGFAPTPGAWGAQAGISLSSSPGCVIERNLIFGNREGFNFREQTRTTPTIDDRASHAVWNHDELIQHNLIAFNRDAQVWGWFDVKDDRHWPATNSLSASAGNPGSGSVAEPRSNELAVAQPEVLTLEGLRLRFTDNVFFAAPGQGWFNWGPTWSRRQSYPSLREFQSALAIDSGGQALDPGFADPDALDFRIGPGAAKILKENYPRGPVPGVVLGVR